MVAAYNSIDNENADFVCDGTDDQVEINAAMDNLPGIGGSIYLREGTYVLSDNIIISRSNVALIGAGASTVLKVKDNLAADMYVIYASGKFNLLIRDLRIDGNRWNQPPGYEHSGIYFNIVENSKIVNTWVENLSIYGILLEGSSNNTVSGNTCQRNGLDGIGLDSSDNNTVTGNTCQGNSYYGIYLGFSSNNTISSNTCHGNANGVFIDWDSDYNNIQGNACRGNGTYGIRINHDTCDGTLVANNDCYMGGTTAGISDAGTRTSFGAGNRNRDGTWATTPN